MSLIIADACDSCGHRHSTHLCPECGLQLCDAHHECPECGNDQFAPCFDYDQFED